MAGKEFPLSLIIRAVDKATGPLRKITKRLDRIGKVATRAGKSLTAGLTLPIVGLGVASVSALAKFETGMSNVSTLIDTSTESMDAMGKSVLQIGRRTPVAVSDLTAALFDVRSAGIDAAGAMTVLEQSARLGVAGLGTTKQSTDLVTSSINAFQLEGKEAARVYDLIFKATKFGKTNIAELSQGFGAVAGTVKATGTELDEYLASVSALTTVGLPASQAHSQLRAVMSGLTRDTTQARKVFRKLGAKDFKDLIAKSGGLVPALTKISEALGGNEAKILKLVGSTEAMNAVLGLTGGQNEAFTNTLREMREGANAVDEAFEKQNKTMRARAQRTKNALTSLGVTVGRILVPALEKLSEILEGVADWFESLSPATKKWIVRIAAVAAAIGPLVFIGGKLATVLSVLAGGIGIVSVAVKALTVFLIANPLGLVVVALAAGGALIYAAWEPIKELLDDIARAIGSVDTAIDNAKLLPGFLFDPSGAVFNLVGAENAGTVFGRKLQMRGQSNLELARPPRNGAFSAAAQKVESALKVVFENAPRGTRVMVDPQSDAVVDTSLGIQMEPAL